jgi:hypothetical protein
MSASIPNGLSAVGGFAVRVLTLVPAIQWRNESEQSLLDFDAGGGARRARRCCSAKSERQRIFIDYFRNTSYAARIVEAIPSRPPAGTAAGAGPSRTGRNKRAANALKTNDLAKWLISPPNDFNGLQPLLRNRSFRLRNEAFRFCRFWPRPGSTRNDRPRLRSAALPLHRASPGPLPRTATPRRGG